MGWSVRSRLTFWQGRGDRFALVFAAALAVGASAATRASATDEAAPAPANGATAEQRVLTSVAEIFQVPRDTEGISVPVSIEGVVTFTAAASSSFFIHDGNMGIHVHQPAGPRVVLGDRVKVIGVTRRGRYAPSVVGRQVITLGTGVFPQARVATMAQIASGAMDSQWLEFDGVVWSIDVSDDNQYVVLQLARDGGRVRAVISNPPPLRPELAIDSEVRVRGVATGAFNQQEQMVEPQLRVPSMSWVTVTRAAPSDPFASAARTVSRLLEFSPESQPMHRVKVRAVVTRRVGAAAVYLRDADRGLRVETQGGAELQPGDIIEAAGFPVISNNEVMMHGAVVRKVDHGSVPSAIRSTPTRLLDGSHASDLVSVDARLVDTVFDGASTTFVCETQGQVFKAILSHARDDSHPLAEKDSAVRLTGICAISEVENLWYYRPRSFVLLLAGLDDLRVLARPPWWTAERLGRALVISLLALASGAGWVWLLHRQVQKKRSVIEYQAKHTAVLEERSRIARDLHDTLEQGLTGLSLQFKSIELTLADESNGPARSHLARARQMLRQSRALARNAIQELRTDAVTSTPEPLIAALDHMADTWNRSGALTVQIETKGESQELPRHIEHNLAAIAGEAVTNAVKHGAAEKVMIHLEFLPGAVLLRVKDNGCGFNPTNGSEPDDVRGTHFGLIGMRERAREAGGRIEIRSALGHGTEIEVEAPAVPPTASTV